MTHDYEVARKVWEAQIPVEISLEGASNEIRPFYIMLPRCSYFGLHMQKILQYFANYEDCENLEGKNLWMECMGQPLKTYYPVGVLYDMLKPSQVDIFSVVLRTENTSESAVIVQKDTLEAMFMQSVKEADYLKRKAEVITAMKPEEHHQLWSGVAHYRFDEFWTVNKRLMETTDGKPFLHVPLRFYETGKPFRQIPLRPQQESGEPMLLKNALAVAYPDTDPSSRRVVSHGINVPLETPIAYLAKNLSYPDNFVHITLM